MDQLHPTEAQTLLQTDPQAVLLDVVERKFYIFGL